MKRLHVGRGTVLVALLCLMAAVGAIIGHSSHPKTSYQKPAMWMPSPTGLAAKDVPVTSGGTTTTVADTSAAVHIVRELTAKRDASSISYLLSNGLNETHFFGEPVNYKNADGAWTRIDTKLIADSSGTLHTAATSGSLTLAKKTGSAAPVRLANAGSVLAVDVLGLDSTHLSASKNSATYADAAPGVSVTYTALSTGLEQTINLAGADAANTFTCTVRSPGLSLRATGQGTWAFFAPDEARPKFYLSNFLVTDSAGGPEGDPAVCSDAKITVKSKGDVSHLTYTVPRSWLACMVSTFLDT